MFLKQSTVQTIQMGPAVDATDGVTPETLLSPVVEVSKNGAAFVARSSITAITHDQEGWYLVELDATDTSTTGKFIAKFDDPATHLPVWHEFIVLPGPIYDALVAGTDKLQVDLTEIGGVAQSATDLKSFADAGYDPVTGKVEGVKTVDTTTTNTDMRGTDNAFLASSAPTNFSDLAITLTTGQVTVATNNDKTGYSISGTKQTLDALNDVSPTQVNAEVDNALNTAIPASPTAGSVNDVLKIQKDNKH